AARSNISFSRAWRSRERTLACFSLDLSFLPVLGSAPHWVQKSSDAWQRWPHAWHWMTGMALGFGGASSSARAMGAAAGAGRSMGSDGESGSAAAAVWGLALDEADVFAASRHSWQM